MLDIILNMDLQFYVYDHISMRMNNVREIDLKNRTYYFFDDMINIKILDKINIDISSIFSFATLVM